MRLDRRARATLANLTPITLLVAAACGPVLTAACGPGAAAEAVRPKDQTAGSALGEGAAASCHAVEARGEPLVVDWKPEQRADLEEAMHDGVAIANFSCDGLKLLKDCRLEGQYGFLGMTRREQMVRLENSDEVRANLPTLGATIGGGLARGSTIDVAMVMVGKRRTTWQTPTTADLKGNCATATHFVRGAIVGAFVMETGTTAQVRASAEMFGAGVSGKSDSAKSVRNQEGDPKDCTSGPDAPKPPGQCGAAVRLELIAITKAPEDKSAAPPAAPTAKLASAIVAVEEPCPEGMVLTAGKCSVKANAASFLCEPRAQSECEEQCKKGNAGSCGALGALLAEGKDPVKAAALFKQACDANDVPSCTNLGRVLANGAGVAKDPSAAAKVLEKSCSDGDAPGCGVLGAMLATGEGAPKDEPRAAVLLGRGCDGGFTPSCADLGMMLLDGRGVTADKKKGGELLVRACQGNHPKSCARVGELKETSGDVIAASIFYMKACDIGGFVPACTDLARLEHAGKAGVSSQAKRHFERACNDRDAIACAALKVAFGGTMPAMDVALSQRLTQSCNGSGSPRDCAASGVLDAAGGNAAMGKPKLERACRANDAWACILAKSVH